jgi:phage major head subunit gpT-like protein
MAALNENWAELLEPGLRMIFDVATGELAAQSKIPMLYNVTSSSKSAEHDLGVGSFGNWDEYTGAIEYDDAEQGYKTTYTHVEFARGFTVERKLVDDDQYNVINQMPRKLGIGAMRKREIDAASVFNNAFSSSFIGGDSVELCGAHPYSPSNASTQDNSGATALSYDSVIATRKLMRSYEDDRGELVPINPNTLLVPPELENTAWEIVNSMNKPGTADNDGNYVRSTGLQVVVWDYLTDANNWFMLDSGLAGMYLNWFNRVPLEFAADPTSDYTLMARYRGYMRYSYGWSDWRFVYGHEVA